MHSIKKIILGAVLATLASSPALADPGPWVETKTPLVGSTTFTGTARYLNPLGAGATSATFFGAQVFADQAGTAYIDISDDGATWNIASQATLSANTASDLSVPIRSAYYRVRVVNGGSDETVLRVFSSQTQSGPGGSAASGGGDASAANQTAVIGTKAAGTAAANSELVGGVFNTALPTLTNGQQAAAQFDSSGRLIVNIGAGASSGAVSQGSTTSGQTVVPMGCRTLTSAPTDTTAQTNMPSCTTAGALRTDASASTQPISAASLPLPTGAATATNQTNVTGTVAAGAAAANSQLTGCIYNSTEPSPTTGQGLGNQCDSKGRQRQVIMDAAGNTRGANVTAANALVVDESAVTQPMSAASLPLPTGASTSALQPTNAAQGSTTSGQTGPLVQCSVTTAAPTYTTAQTSPVNCTTGGGVRVLDANSAALLAAAQAGTGSTGSAVPASAIYSGANSSGNLTGIIQADASVSINISTATTTQLVALVSGKKIYVTNYKVIAGGTGNFKFVYGTGSNCGTGTTDLEGANNLTAQTGSSDGGGLGPVLIVPASNALCATTSAAVQMSGHAAYTQAP